MVSFEIELEEVEKSTGDKRAQKKASSALDDPLEGHYESHGCGSRWISVSVLGFRLCQGHGIAGRTRRRLIPGLVREAEEIFVPPEGSRFGCSSGMWLVAENETQQPISLSLLSLSLLGCW